MSDFEVITSVKKVGPTAHQLYRMFAHDGQLLYIGISKSALVRMTQHAGEKPWWGEVTRIEIEHYELFRDEMEAIERKAIKSEQPKYNKAHRSMDPRYLTIHERGLLSDVCERCGRPYCPIEAVELPNGKTLAYFLCRSCERTWWAEWAA